MRRLILCSFVIGCGDSDANGGDAPRVEIVTPREDATVCGTPMQVDVLVENFELVALGGETAEGAGHVDFSVNGQAVTMTDETSFEVPRLEDGLYQLQAELVRADHTSLDPYAGHTIYVTVDATACQE